MAIETISYSRPGQGWATFHSFIPDWMIGMNSSLYSFNNGDLYLHDSNETRNNYYGVQYTSRISPIINQAWNDVKVFESICQEGNSPWSVTLTTDLNEGSISATSFEEKEGEYYAYIRRNAGSIDLKSSYVNGVGSVQSYTPGGGTDGAIEILGLTDQYICEGDSIYRNDSGVNTLIGVVQSVAGDVITIDPVSNVPNVADFLFLVKDSVAESDGLRGYYMQVDMENTSTEQVELALVCSDAIKSYP